MALPSAEIDELKEYMRWFISNRRPESNELLVSPGLEELFPPLAKMARKYLEVRRRFFLRDTSRKA
jgi:hypothetical protein